MLGPTSPEFQLQQKEELYRLGEITDVTVVSHEKYGIDDSLAPLAIYELKVDDPYIKEADQDMLAAIDQYEAYLDDLACQRREAGLWERKAGTAYVDGDGNEASKDVTEWGDPVARAEGFGSVGSEALIAWRTKVPSAAALGDLSEPFAKDTLIDKDNNEVFFDDIAKHWLAGCTDARAIRNRGTVMAELVKNYVSSNAATDGLKWMSVACGTALPAMKAATHANISPQLTLVDWDVSAMEATASLAEEVNFKGELVKHATNIFNEHDLAKLRDSLGNNGDRPKILDLMGIFEYTGEHIGVDPVTFLRANYDMLSPGGSLIFGQMRSDRPRQDFTMGVIGWPYIAMRSPAEVMAIIAEAGIDTNSVNVFLPEDGVYTICEVRKPLGPETFATNIAA